MVYKAKPGKLICDTSNGFNSSPGLINLVRVPCVTYSDLMVMKETLEQPWTHKNWTHVKSIRNSSTFHMTNLQMQLVVHASWNEVPNTNFSFASHWYDNGGGMIIVKTSDLISEHSRLNIVNCLFLFYKKRNNILKHKALTICFFFVVLRFKSMFWILVCWFCCTRTTKVNI